MRKVDLLLAGVGGQGVILASDILAETAMEADYDVKKTDVLGMAQRGGSVVSHVRLGPQVHSPLVKRGQADILLSFEKLEAARWAAHLAPDALAIVNDDSVYPLAVSSGAEQYPSDEEVINILGRQPGKLHMVDAMAIADEFGNKRVANVIMLGFLSHFLDIDYDHWRHCLSQRLPSRVVALNEAAFKRGRAEAESKTAAHRVAANARQGGS